MKPKTTRPSASAMKIRAFDAISGLSLIAPMAAEPTFEIAIPAPSAPSPNATAAAIQTHAVVYWPAEGSAIAVSAA